jgi:hypothetical protein
VLRTGIGTQCGFKAGPLCEVNSTGVHATWLHSGFISTPHSVMAACYHPVVLPATDCRPFCGKIIYKILSEHVACIGEWALHRVHGL